ncbi:hypothetical protein ACP275_07G083300 [Erythranthe tilingii]
MSTVFFNTSAEIVAWWMFKYVRDIDQTMAYNWPMGITEFLQHQIHIAKELDKTKGCIPLILYFICERTNLVQPVTVNAFPRFRRWVIQELANVISTTAIRDIQPEDVNDQPLVPTHTETQILTGHFAMEESSDDEADDTDDGSTDSEEREAMASSALHEITNQMSTEGDNITDPFAQNVTKIGERIVADSETDDDPTADIDVPIAVWLKQQYREMQQEVDKLKNEIEACHSRESSLRRQVTQLTNEADVLRGTITRLESQIKALQSRVDRLNAITSPSSQEKTKHVIILAKQVDEVNLKLADAMKHIDVQNSELSTLKTENSRMATEIQQQEEVQVRMTLLGNMAHVLLGEKRALQDKLAKLENEQDLGNNDWPSFDILTPTQTSIAQKNKDLDHSHAQNIELHVRLAELEAANKSLVQKLANTTPDQSAHHPSRILVNPACEESRSLLMEDVQLTNMSESIAQILFLEAEKTLLKSAENEHMATIKARDEKISELETIIDQYSRALDNRPPVIQVPKIDFEICEEKNPKNPKSAIGNRTRSKKPTVTPRNTKKARRDLRHKHELRYTEMSDSDHKRVNALADELLNGDKSIWKHGTTHILITDIFHLLRLEQTSNNAAKYSCTNKRSDVTQLPKEMNLPAQLLCLTAYC